VSETSPRTPAACRSTTPVQTWGAQFVGQSFPLARTTLDLPAGTEQMGYIELRKYIDIATSNGGEQLLLVDGKGEHRIPCGGNVGFPFFGELILDCLHGTEKAMTQRHTFLAAELCLKAQKAALRLDRPPF
jgi:hypothetical protein